jgi:hypothetical protein
MEHQPWFRTRSSGLGWTPITWQGWLVTILSCLIFLALDLALVFHFAIY